MSRYIDTELLDNTVDELNRNGYDISGTTLVQVKNILSHIPTADVVEVVRCKDCVYHYNPLADCCGVPFVTNDDDFCSWGERIEDGKND